MFESKLSILYGGLSVGAGVMAWISKKQNEKRDIKRNEIAFIYNCKKLND